MKKIFIAEGCFGPIVRVDGEDIELSEHDTRTEEDVDKLRMYIIQELTNNRKMLTSYEWRDIIEIMASRCQWNVIDESSDSCDQCGNYNWDKTYER